jgi:hypothetical protein
VGDSEKNKGLRRKRSDEYFPGNIRRVAVTFKKTVFLTDNTMKPSNLT